MTSASASRVTRSSRSLRLAILLFLGVLAGVTVLRAQGTPPAANPPPPASQEPAPAQVEPPAAATAPAKAGTPAAGANAPVPAGPSPGRFEPSEKVRADFDVAFPIDI